MSNDDWYRRHLGGGGSTSTGFPPPRQGPAPSYQPQGYQPPPGYVLVPQAYAGPQPQPQWPGQAPVDPTAQYLAAMGVSLGHANPWAEPPPSPVDTSRIPRGAINAENFLQLANLWRGGRGKKEAEHCPRCDGVLFRRFVGQKEAAPLCTSCGWNGMWEQGEHAHVAA